MFWPSSPPGSSCGITEGTRLRGVPRTRPFTSPQEVLALFPAGPSSCHRCHISKSHHTRNPTQAQRLMKGEPQGQSEGLTVKQPVGQAQGWTGRLTGQNVRQRQATLCVTLSFWHGANLVTSFPGYWSLPAGCRGAPACWHLGLAHSSPCGKEGTFCCHLYGKVQTS